MSTGHYGDITIDVSGAAYETGFKFNTLPFGGLTIDTGNSVRLSSAADIRLAPPSGRYVFVQTTGTKDATATSDHRGALFLERGADGVPDKLYICLKTSAQNPETFTWVEIATG